MKNLSEDEKIQLIRIYRAAILTAIADAHNGELGEAAASAERQRVARIFHQHVAVTPEMEGITSLGLILGLQTLVDNLIFWGSKDEYFQKLQAEHDAFVGGNGVNRGN
jgi:hypothetical protein